MDRYDLVVIGSGVAGMTAALAGAARGRTLLLTKDTVEESNTRYAQGGIAAAIGDGDSAQAHRADTIAAGAGLVDPVAATVLTAEARSAIEELVRLGVPFDLSGGGIALGREAAHSAARIVHAGGDATGVYLEHTLAERVRAAGVELREYAFVTRLLIEAGRVAGIEILDAESGAVASVDAAAVILATGGAGQLYSHTTNSSVATGDGIALAYRAGAEVMDMEFIQFHPTALRLPGAPAFLISEAVRGEGAVLRDCDGRAFMTDFDPRAELAPRDIVARAIHTRMALTGANCVYLDLSHLPAGRVRMRFPQIDAFCRSHGLDITRDRIPVAPAAHYTMGGVRATEWGETNVGGLFAAGEAACTGVHGANRLASNSLLEGLVFARRAVERAFQQRGPARPNPTALSLPPCRPGETGVPALADLQRLMWDGAGIVRDAGGLERARAALSAWEAIIPPPTSRQTRELANLILVGRLIVEAAWQRTESRGAHYRADYPETSASWQQHQVFRKE